MRILVASLVTLWFVTTLAVGGWVGHEDGWEEGIWAAAMMVFLGLVGCVLFLAVGALVSLWEWAL